MTFAAITLALVLGSVVERIKFSAVMVFGIVWLTIVYFPIAHMVWGGQWPVLRQGRARFRRRHRGAHQFRRFGAGRVHHPRQAHRLSEGADAAALADDDRNRHRPAVGGLVRLQCRLGAGSERLGRAGDDQHLRRHCRRGHLLDGLREAVRPQEFGAGLLLGHHRRPRRGHTCGRQLGSVRCDRARRHRLARLLPGGDQAEAGARL